MQKTLAMATTRNIFQWPIKNLDYNWSCLLPGIT